MSFRVIAEKGISKYVVCHDGQKIVHFVILDYPLETVSGQKNCSVDGTAVAAEARVSFLSKSERDKIFRPELEAEISGVLGT